MTPGNDQVLPTYFMSPGFYFTERRECLDQGIGAGTDQKGRHVREAATCQTGRRGREVASTMTEFRGQEIEADTETTGFRGLGTEVNTAQLRK